MKIPYETPTALGREFIELVPDIVAVILLTVAAGWRHAQAAADVNANAGEVFITEHLRDGMRHVQKEAPKDSPYKQIWVLPGTESRSKNNVILPDGRTDIPLAFVEIFMRTGEHDPHAIIECKRIAGTDTHLCREYVVEGMDRFIQEKYGENHAVGFMVGYVLSGALSESADGVNAYLKRSSREPDVLALSDIDVPTWLSQHTRSSRSKSICLHHMFLGFPLSLTD